MRTADGGWKGPCDEHRNVDPTAGLRIGYLLAPNVSTRYGLAQMDGAHMAHDHGHYPRAQLAMRNAHALAENAGLTQARKATLSGKGALPRAAVETARRAGVRTGVHALMRFSPAEANQTQGDGNEGDQRSDIH